MHFYMSICCGGGMVNASACAQKVQKGNLHSMLPIRCCCCFRCTHEDGNKCVRMWSKKARSSLFFLSIMVCYCINLCEIRRDLPSLLRVLGSNE